MNERPVDRGMLEILSWTECWDLVGREPLGRIAFVDGDEPAVLPVNHVRDEHTVLFRTTHGGRRSTRSIAGPVVFEVDGYDSDDRTGWSVLIHGQAEQLEAATAIERLADLGHELRGDQAHAAVWVEVAPEHVSGRRIPPRDD